MICGGKYAYVTTALHAGKCLTPCPGMICDAQPLYPREKTIYTFWMGAGIKLKIRFEDTCCHKTRQAVYV
jgi:hypothetical protein